MEVKITNYLKSLEGMTFEEWSRLKMLIDNEFAEIKQKNTFNNSENVLKRLESINRLETHLTGRE